MELLCCIVHHLIVEHLCIELQISDSQMLK